jgi:transcriptional regulator with XRE-family HTH domain
LSNDLGIVLKERRLGEQMTIQELSDTSGVSVSHLARIERGERFPSARVLQKIALPLGFDDSELLILAGYRSPRPSEAEKDESKLDPYVAGVLSQEPVEVQRTVIYILSILKTMEGKGDQSIE